MSSNNIDGTELNKIHKTEVIKQKSDAVLLTGHNDGQFLFLLSCFVLGETGIGARVLCTSRAKNQIQTILEDTAFSGQMLTRLLPPHLRLGVTARRLAGNTLQRVIREDTRLSSLHVVDF